MRPDTRSRRMRRLPGFLAAVGLAVQTATAVAPLVTVTSIQPSTAPSVPDETYEPAALSAFVAHEPTAYPTLPGFGHRVTVDVEVENNEPNYIRLDEYETNIGGWSEDLVGQELLAMPETLFLFKLGPTDNRRPALTNGGFAVSGLKLEHHVIDDNNESALTFGEALDVLAYDLDDGEGYLVAGSYQFLIGDVPTSVNDPPPSVGTQGFIAKYDAAGVMIARLPTAQDEASAIADVGNGLYLVAGRYEHVDGSTALMLRRVRSWETVDGDSTDLDHVALDFDYGADKENSRTLVPFYDGGKPCEVERAIDATVAENGKYHVVAVELDCSTGSRIGLAVTLADGALLQSFGSGGSKVLAGPGVVEAIPVGVETQAPALGLAPPGPVTKNRWVWLGAAVGPDCHPVGDACSFALTRIDYVSGAQHTAGWFTPTEQSKFVGARPRDMALDKQGRPVMAGVVELTNGKRLIAVHRFRTNGQTDAVFGTGGWSVQSLNGHDGDAYAVRPRKNGEIAIAVLSTEDTPAGLDWSMAMMNLSAAGSPTWQHSPYASGDSFTHMSVRTDLNYGYRYETEVTSLPWALTEDWHERLVMVGFGGSAYLQNPCELVAEELNEPLLDYGIACGGPGTIALARYLPFGEPHSRRWLAPEEKRSMVVPSDLHFGFAPAAMILELKFDGFNQLNIVRDLVPFQNAIADVETNSFGAYRFPFAPSILEFEERFSLTAHPLDHHHRNASGNRFAYDIDIVRWTGSDWTSTTTDESATGNESRLVWGRGVRAVASGKVVSCRRSAPDNPLHVVENKDANFVKIQHTFDPFDLYEGGIHLVPSLEAGQRAARCLSEYLSGRFTGLRPRDRRCRPGRRRTAHPSRCARRPVHWKRRQLRQFHGAAPSRTRDDRGIRNRELPAAVPRGDAAKRGRESGRTHVAGRQCGDPAREPGVSDRLMDKNLEGSHRMLESMAAPRDHRTSCLEFRDAVVVR